jgi:hypothetical protein
VNSRRKVSWILLLLSRQLKVCGAAALCDPWTFLPLPSPTASGGHALYSSRSRPPTTNAPVKGPWRGPCRANARAARAPGASQRRCTGLWQGQRHPRQAARRRGPTLQGVRRALAAPHARRVPPLPERSLDQHCGTRSSSALRARHRRESSAAGGMHTAGHASAGSMLSPGQAWRAGARGGRAWLHLRQTCVHAPSSPPTAQLPRSRRPTRRTPTPHLHCRRRTPLLPSPPVPAQLPAQGLPQPPHGHILGVLKPL